jgi:cytochrome c5
MSDNSQEHETFIKTPGQLIAGVVLAFVVFIAIAALASQLATSGRAGAPSPEATAKLIAPVAKVEVGAAEAAVKGARTGEQVYAAACAACHDSGAAGAPKVGDKSAWGARLGQGLEGLLKSAINGKGAMPARGGNPDLADVEIARAVVLMANKSGGSLKEPAAK